jgi:hypothetical protein
MGLAVLPRRDAEARGRLAEVDAHTRPLLLARDRAIGLDSSLADLLPGGSLARGIVVRVAASQTAPCRNGEVGGVGATSVTASLAAAVTAAGEWAAAVDLDGSFGALAAAEAGVALERFAVVRRVPPARWATVVAALLEGVTLVIADIPRGIALGDARRLTARARERDAVLVVHERADASWSAPAALTLRASGGAWDLTAGHLVARAVHVVVEGRGVAARPVTGELARAV